MSGRFNHLANVWLRSEDAPWREVNELVVNTLAMVARLRARLDTYRWSLLCHHALQMK